MSAFDEGFQKDVLARSIQDPVFRKRVKVSLGEVSPWYVDVFEDLWGVIENLGSRDTFSPQLVRTAFKDIDDSDYLEELVDTAKRLSKFEPVAAEFAATELESWAKHKSLEIAASRLVSALSDGNVEDAERILRRAVSSTAEFKKHVEGGDWFDGFEERQAKRQEEKENPKDFTTIRTGLPHLDKKLNGGLRLGQVGVIVGKTNIGKSFFANEFSIKGAGQGFVVVQIVTEMSKEEVDTRHDSRFFMRDSADFMGFNFSQQDLDDFKARYKKSKGMLRKKLFTYSVPVNSLTFDGINEILDEVEEIAGDRVSLLVLDSADHMKAMNQRQDKRLQQAAVYWDIKQIAGERNVAVWTTCHTSEVGNGLLKVEDTAESKEKGKIASVVCTLNQTAQEHRENLIRLYLAKNRNGEKFSTHWIRTDFARASIREEDPPPEDEEDDE